MVGDCVNTSFLDGEVEGFIEWRIKAYKREEWRGKYLWEVFEDGFEGFTKKHFEEEKTRRGS